MRFVLQVIPCLVVACADPGERAACELANGLDGAWNPYARIVWQTSLAARGTPNAASYAQAAATTIDLWVTSWRRESTASCRSGSELAVRGRQQACLVARRDELAALLVVLADRSTDAEQAPLAAAALGDLDTCASTVGTARPPTATPRLDEARRKLASARALYTVARIDDARRELTALATTVDALGDRALAGEVALWRARVELQSEQETEAARPLLSEALAHARAAQDARLEAYVRIAELELVPNGARPIERAVEIARAACTAAGDDPALRSELMGQIARLTLGPAKTISAFEDAIAQQRLRTPIDRVRLAHLSRSLGAELGELGEHPRALALFNKALQHVSEALGAAHPRVANVWVDRAVPLSRLYSAELAAESLRTALAIDELALSGVPLADARTHIAGTYEELGYRPEAAALYRRILDDAAVALGPDSPKLGELWLELSAIEWRMGRRAEAAAALRTALAIHERAYGRDHVALVKPLVELAGLELDRAPRAAVPLLERAVAIGEARAAAPVLLADAYFLQAKATFARTRDRGRAHERASKATAILIALAYAGESTAYQLHEIQLWVANVCKCRTGRRS